MIQSNFIISIIISLYMLRCGRDVGMIHILNINPMRKIKWCLDYSFHGSELFYSV